MWARIFAGAVAEITDVDPTGRFDSSMIWYPCDGTVQVTWTASEAGGVWTFTAPPPPPPPTAAQLAAGAYASFVGSGLTVTSTGTPALSGLYAIDDASQTDIATEAQFISTFAEFTTGATTNLPWPMPNGSITIFPTTAAFLSFAKVAGQAVAAAKLALAQSAAMPAPTATIP